MDEQQQKIAKKGKPEDSHGPQNSTTLSPSFLFSHLQSWLMYGTVVAQHGKSNHLLSYLFSIISIFRRRKLKGMPEGKHRGKQKPVFAAAFSEKVQVRVMYLRSYIASTHKAEESLAFISAFRQRPAFC